MNEQILTELVADGKSTREIAKEASISQTTVRHWLKKYNLSTASKAKKVEEYGYKTCTVCKNEKNINDFYFKNKTKSCLRDSTCKVCSVNKSVERFREIKRKCVDYKGGKCSICGYNKSLSALDFHHLDPKQKDFNISEVKNCTLTDKIFEELDKCILVCSNCHREIHCGGMDGT